MTAIIRDAGAYHDCECCPAPVIEATYAEHAARLRADTIGPDAVWPLVPGTTGLYASPDGRWRAHRETYGASWILRDMDRSGAERGFYSLAEMRAYVARQYPESMEDRS